MLNIRAEGEALQDKLVLNSLTAIDGKKKGQFSAEGEIALLPAEFFPFRFHVDFTRLSAVQIDLVTAEAQGNIQITGNAKRRAAKGQIEVIESDLDIPAISPCSLPNLTVVYRNAIKPIQHPELDASPPYPLRLDLEVKAPEGIFIGGRGLDSEWKGDFHIGGEYTSIAAKGKLELIKGRFLFSADLLS